MRISCILPVFNSQRFVAEALETVLSQDDPDLEVLVVDDGSTDGTLEILSRLQGEIRVIRQDHRGCAAARNLGLAEAQGELIAFQDSDDLWTPGKLRRQRARFEARPDLELCFGFVQNFWMKEVAEEEAAFQGRRFAEPVPGVALPVLLARRSVFHRVGPFDETLQRGSDTDWFLRARDAGVVEEVMPDILLKRRLHAGNMSRGNLSNQQLLIRLMKSSLDRRRSAGEV